jgi:hypothetical protein
VNTFGGRRDACYLRSATSAIQGREPIWAREWGEMPMSEKDMLLVLGASYDDREDAERDYEAIKSLYREVGVTHDFDAAVLERDDEGEVHVLKKHEQPTRHGAARGLGWASPSGRDGDLSGDRAGPAGSSRAVVRAPRSAP